jgi:hypothetical protein
MGPHFQIVLDYCFLNFILQVSKVKWTPGFNYLSTTPWRCMAEWRYCSTILNLVTIWRWVISFMSLLLCPQGNSPQYLMYKGLGWPQRWSEHYGKKRRTSLPRRNGTLTPGDCTVLNFFWTGVRMLPGHWLSFVLWGVVEDPRLISCNNFT